MGRFISCCVPGCRSKKPIPLRFKLHDSAAPEPSCPEFFLFPEEPERRDLWLSAINRKNLDCTSWIPAPKSLICGEHFVGGVPSLDENDEAYVPSKFPRGAVPAIPPRRSSRQSINRESPEYPGDEEESILDQNKTFSGFTQKQITRTKLVHTGFLNYVKELKPRKRKLVPTDSPRENKKNKLSNDLTNDAHVLPPTVAKSTPARKSVPVKKPISRPIVSTDVVLPVSRAPMEPRVCSILCPAAMGCIPTLQCTSCVCLYHPPCLGLDASWAENKKFECRNCKAKVDTNRAEDTPTQPDHKMRYNHIMNLHPKPSSSHTQAKRKVSRPAAANSSAVKPVFNKTFFNKIPSKVISPAQVPRSNSSVRSRQDDDDMQSIVQVGCYRFIAIPTKPNNSIIKSLPNLPVSAATSPAPVSKTPPISGGIILPPVSVPSESQTLLPGNATTKSPLGGAYIVTNNNPSNMGVVLAMPQTTSQYLVLNNGQMQSLLTAPSLIMDQTQKKPLPVAQFQPKNDLFSNASTSFDILIKIFSFLRLDELSKMGCVNRFFYAASRHFSLWETVRLENCHVKSWDRLTALLSRYETRELNCNKMIIAQQSEEFKLTWLSIRDMIQKTSSLRRLTLGKCIGPEINIAKDCRQLTHFSCSFSKKNLMDFAGFANVTHLVRLFIRGSELRRYVALSIVNESALVQLKSLRELSLTSVRTEAAEGNWAMFLKDMTQLEWLELGECTHFSTEFVTNVLKKMGKLKRLRLETVTETLACDILDVVATLPLLDTLELINIDVKQGFESAMIRCKNVRHLLIVPTYVRHSGYTVHSLKCALSAMHKTLHQVVWAFTHELLKVTEMLISQYDLEFDPSASDYVPMIPKRGMQVDVVSISKLEEMLKKEMTDTKSVCLLKVPYVNTVKLFLPENFTWGRSEKK